MPRRPFDIAVFDFDGTLVASNAVKTEGFQQVAARYAGGAEAMTNIYAIPGLDRFQVMDRFANALNLPDPDVLVAAYTELVDSAVIEAPAIPGAIELLTALGQAGVARHLNSATPLVSLRAIVEARGWARYFEGLHGRPASKIENLNTLPAQPDRIAVIGDGPDDLESAEAVGATFFAVGDRLTDLPDHPLRLLSSLAPLLLGEPEATT